MKYFYQLYIGAILCTSVAVHAETRLTYHHWDLFGTTVAATNEAGEVIWRKDYTPYGETQSKDGANTVGFTGHQEDDLTGLTQMQRRYYDPQIGQFLSQDPVGFTESNPMSFNRYAYANNNPYKFVDPDGRAAFLALIPPALEVIGAGIAGYETGSAISDVARGEKTVGEAAGDAAVGVGIGIATGGAGKILGAASKNTVTVWKSLAKERQNSVNSFMTQYGKGAEGAKRLLDDINIHGVPRGLDKEAFSSYQNQITKVGGSKAATKNSEVFQSRQKILSKISKEDD